MDTAQSMARRRQGFWWVRTLFNPLAKSILRSPLHGGMSRRLLLITFPGRKSGKRYTTPISYVQHGDTLLLGVGGRWWKNLRGGVPVQVLLRGKTYAGRAEAWTDEASMTRAYRTILAENPTQARFMGITATSDVQPDPHAVQQALQRGAAVVEITLLSPVHLPS
jgi:deazaflavin-dependent oxidoreductase (nitroreductase family)